MKKNRLYTLNKWNQPAFTGNPNLFPIGGPVQVSPSELQVGNTLGQTLLNKPVTGLAQNALDNINKQQLDNYLGSTNFLGISKKSNPFSKVNLAGGIAKGIGTAGLNAGIGAVAGAVGGFAKSAIADGYDTGAGNAVAGLGSTIGGALSNVNPLLGGIVTVGSGIVGGGINRLFGEKVDTARLNQANADISNLSNFRSNAGSFDDVQGPAAVANIGGIYKGGIWNSSAERKQKALEEKMLAAKQFADRSISNNSGNLVLDQLSDSLYNYAALGGPIEIGDSTGAIGYDFMDRYLTAKEKQAAKGRQTGVNQMPAFMPNSFAIGGDLQTNGADWSTGLAAIGAGGSHEDNPNEGVQLGTDPEGVPNLVEEGETVFNDYVYSNRIKCDDATKQLFHISKKRDITYADLSKRLEKEIAERPNDPISKAGFEKQMQMLEEQQERQKAEMEAERAKAAFDALSPGEQTALMQQRAEQEAMAQQQAAMQQPTPEEIDMVQQQMQQADGSEAVLGQEPDRHYIDDGAVAMAKGGKLFAPGGYLWDKFWSPVNEYSKKKGNTKGKYQIDKEWKGNIKELEDSEAYKAFTNYILNDATNEERMKYFQWIDANTGRDNKYIIDGKLADDWKDMYQAARTDGLYGIQHYTPEWQAAEASQEPSVLTSPSSTSTPRVFHALVDDEDYIQGELDPNVVGAEVRRTVLPNGDTVIYHDRMKAANTDDSGTNDIGKTPRHKAGWLRYAGLFGPAVGLGLQAAGIGRPDTAGIDASLRGAGDVSLARWKPIGNYLTYRPLDIWYQQNALNAQSRATDRNLMNISGNNRGAVAAGLLANGYNSQIASGNLFRQAQEYNDNLRKQVEDFNRGTNQYNSEQYGITSRFNADARNRARQANAQLRLHAAAQKADMDAGWNQGIYGNIAGLFKGLGDIGRENEQFNWLSDLAADGAFGNLGTSNTGRRWTKEKKSKGGKIKKRGLTI